MKYKVGDITSDSLYDYREFMETISLRFIFQTFKDPANSYTYHRYAKGLKQETNHMSLMAGYEIMGPIYTDIFRESI